MISSHLVFLALIAQAAICAVPPPQRIQKPAPSQASSSPGFYGFAVNSATPYVPQVEENQEDSRRRLDLLENHFKARDFTTAGNTAEVAEMEVENEFNGPAILFEEPRRDQEQDVFKALLKKVKILPNVDMGERWDTYFMDRNECRVSIFGVRTHDIQDVLHVMIQFGPIERAWMLDELKRYGRPNIVFVEYAHRWDAQEAIKLAVRILLFYVFTKHFSFREQSSPRKLVFLLVRATTAAVEPGSKSVSRPILTTLTST